jgi:hypothetical protein
MLLPIKKKLVMKPSKDLTRTFGSTKFLDSLSMRVQGVQVATDDWLVAPDVPQGSILGPILYDNLPYSFLKNGIFCRLHNYRKGGGPYVMTLNNQFNQS